MKPWELLQPGRDRAGDRLTIGQPVAGGNGGPLPPPPFPLGARLRSCRNVGGRNARPIRAGPWRLPRSMRRRDAGRYLLARFTGKRAGGSRQDSGEDPRLIAPAGRVRLALLPCPGVPSFSESLIAADSASSAEAAYKIGLPGQVRYHGRAVGHGSRERSRTFRSRVRACDGSAPRLESRELGCLPSALRQPGPREKAPRDVVLARRGLIFRARREHAVRRPLVCFWSLLAIRQSTPRYTLRSGRGRAGSRDHISASAAIDSSAIRPCAAASSWPDVPLIWPAEARTRARFDLEGA